MVIITYPATSIIKQAARHLAEVLQDRVSRHGRVLVLLSGGSGIAVYKEMFKWLDVDVDFNTVDVCLVDERFGPYGHPDSNEQQLYTAGVIAEFEARGAVFTGILQKQTELSDPPRALIKTTHQANKLYSSLLDQADYVIVFAGLGNDGHTAGWLPTDSQETFEHRYSGNSHSPLVCYSGTQQELGNQHTSRITISLSMAAQADEILIYCAGESKYPIIEQVLARDGQPFQLPVLVWQEQLSTLITDYNVTHSH